jgi:phage/plasmid primase-like uncharacterized protein
MSLLKVNIHLSLAYEVTYEFPSLHIIIVGDK